MNLGRNLGNDSSGMRIWLTALLVLSVSTLQAGIPRQDTRQEKLTEVDQARELVKKLAGDAFLGRGTFNEGTAKARDYLVGRFEKMGLTGAFEGKYTQDFPTRKSLRVIRRKLILTNAAGKQVRSFAGDNDFRVLGCSQGGKVSGQVVFVGYAMAHEDEGFDSFAGAGADALEGKIALALRYEPHDKDGVSLWTGKKGRWTSAAGIAAKVAWARKHGAAGLIIANPPAHRDARLLGPQTGLGNYDAQMPVLMARSSLLKVLVDRAKGADLAELKKSADAGKNSIVPLEAVGVTIDLALDRELSKSWNVAARLEGGGTLAGEVVLVGAHYDHLGTRGRSDKPMVFNGADDNASGTAAVMLLARRMKEHYTSADAPEDRRTFVFVLFGAEEIGLVGSRYLADHLGSIGTDAPHVQAMLNFDMVGRLDRNKLTFIRGGKGWDKILQAARKNSSLDVTSVGAYYGGSDHTSFLGKKIPAAMFFTGMHKDYHRPSDTWDKVNYEGLLEVLDLADDIALKVAILPERLQTQGSRVSSDAKRAYLGIICDPEYEGGCRVLRVMDASPASRAGLEPGDIITRWDGRKVDSRPELIALVHAQEPGKEVKLEVLRDDKTQTLMIKLGSR